MKCCGNFYPRERLALEAKGYSERILETGICPQCGNFVVTVCKKDYDGHWTYETAKRKKALRLYEENKASIIGDYIRSLKYGCKSNMGFRYGEYSESKRYKTEKERFKQYAVDFNGTKELLRI